MLGNKQFIPLTFVTFFDAIHNICLIFLKILDNFSIAFSLIKFCRRVSDTLEVYFDSIPIARLCKNC